MLITKYWFWLLMLGLTTTLLERVRPWRGEQKFLRPQLLQDIFWIAFNGYLFGRYFGFINSGINLYLSKTFEFVSGIRPTLGLIVGFPFLIKVLVSIVILDFTEWCVHNLLHRVSWLWRFHRVHHSIKVMDWLGNFRFHWAELIIYNFFKYLPVVIINNNQWEVILTIGVIATAIGNLNHSNLNITWGPLRYILNSPRMHIWHHEKALRFKAGCNFAIVFSIWDWIFGTAYMPRHTLPQAIGFHNDEKVSQNLLIRFFLPFVGGK